MATPSPQPGDLFGHFRLIERIGEGGMGIVYRARDERLQRNVAVKLLSPKTLIDPAASQRFRREALILGRLNHPNVEAVYDFHSEHGLDYLVIEYVAGTSLDDRLHRGALSEKEVISLGLQLASGLAAAHAQGVIHRDLKPGNLRVTPENVLKILDFGLAQLFAAPDAQTLTGTPTVAMETPGFAGTLPYMAPEQLQGQEPDTRSDIYSAGVVLYELATGSRPFPQRGQMLWEAILQSDPPAPRIKNADISPTLEAVILKCLEKDPNRRYQSAKELLAGVSSIAADQNMAIPSEQRSSSLSPATRRKVWRSLAAVVVLIAIAVAVFLRRPPKVEAHQKIMAVLPFDAVGQNSATSALGVGLMETVATRLVEVGHDDTVQVVSPHELSEKGVKSAADARREFGTDMVLEGSLQQSGEELRITCNLVDSKTGRQIGARTITRDVNDLFSLQDETVNAALGMLADARIKIQPSPATRPDTQPAAYEAYIRGRGYLEELKKPDAIDDAVRELTRAVTIDPNYALGYAALGNAYSLGFQQFSKGKEWVANASRNCEKALSLNPDLVEGHVCLGNVSNGTGQYAKAAQEFQRALRSEPSSEEAIVGLANAYTSLGDLSAAEATYERAIALRPNSWLAYSRLGYFYYNQARYSDAAEMFRKSTELAPENYLGYSNLAAMYILLGRYAESIQALKQNISLRPSPEAYGNLGYTYFLMHQFGDAVTASEQVRPSDRAWQNWGNLADALYWTPRRRAEAVDAYRKAISLSLTEVEVNPQAGDTLAYLADYYAMLGDKNLAFTFLQRALKVAPSDSEVLFRAALVHNHFNQREEAFTFLKKAVDAHYSRTIIRDTPDFEPLHQDGRFQALLSQ